MVTLFSWSLAHFVLIIFCPGSRPPSLLLSIARAGTSSFKRDAAIEQRGLRASRMPNSLPQRSRRMVPRKRSTRSSTSGAAGVERGAGGTCISGCRRAFSFSTISRSTFMRAPFRSRPFASDSLLFPFVHARCRAGTGRVILSSSSSLWMRFAPPQRGQVQMLRAARRALAQVQKRTIRRSIRAA